MIFATISPNRNSGRGGAPMLGCSMPSSVALGTPTVIGTQRTTIDHQCTAGLWHAGVLTYDPVQ
jgi:hypothetical protein